MSAPAVLVVEDGHIFRGVAWGATGAACGPAVINTSISGYQQELTDPKNQGAIVVCTSPHVGNVGVHDADARSDKYQAIGLVAREPSRITSNWQAEGDLVNDLNEAKVVGIAKIDTRALAQLLTKNPNMRVGIFSGDALPDALDDLALSTSIPQSIVQELVDLLKANGEGEA